MEKKNFILHGATDFDSSNYGDFLYGEAVYYALKKINPNNEVAFFKPSDFFVNNIPSLKVLNRIDWNKWNYAVYIPGGYFGEGHNSRFKDNLFHMYRFFSFGIKAIFHKKKIIVLAIGAGPINSQLLKYPIKMILRKSVFITTRDHESYKALKATNNKANIIEASDLILTLDMKHYMQNLDNNFNDLINEEKKLLIVHYNHSKEARDKYVEAVNMFLKENDDFSVLVCSDCILNDEKDFNEFKSKLNVEPIFYKYRNPKELTALLNKAKLVLTCKLHLGVVATMLGKSVVVAAVHPGKTMRYYAQIGEKNRCVSLFDANATSIYNLLEFYKSKPISIPDNIYEKAKITWRELNYEIDQK